MKKQEDDNNIFWIMGIPFMGVGLTFMLTINPALGLAFMAMGLAWTVIGVTKWNS